MRTLQRGGINLIELDMLVKLVECFGLLMAKSIERSVNAPTLNKVLTVAVGFAVANKVNALFHSFPIGSSNIEF
jgi:hypothetical protein